MSTTTRRKKDVELSQSPASRTRNALSRNNVSTRATRLKMPAKSLSPVKKNATVAKPACDIPVNTANSNKGASPNKMCSKINRKKNIAKDDANDNLQNDSKTDELKEDEGDAPIRRSVRIRTISEKRDKSDDKLKENSSKRKKVKESKENISVNNSIDSNDETKKKIGTLNTQKPESKVVKEKNIPVKIENKEILNLSTVGNENAVKIIEKPIKPTDEKCIPLKKRNIKVLNPNFQPSDQESTIVPSTISLATDVSLTNVQVNVLSVKTETVNAESEVETKVIKDDIKEVIKMSEEVKEPEKLNVVDHSKVDIVENKTIPETLKLKSTCEPEKTKSRWARSSKLEYPEISSQGNCESINSELNKILKEVTQNVGKIETQVEAITKHADIKLDMGQSNIKMEIKSEIQTEVQKEAETEIAERENKPDNAQNTVTTEKVPNQIQESDETSVKDFDKNVEILEPPKLETLTVDYEVIEENVCRFERKKCKSKKEVRRMLCDCSLTKEEISKGVMGCGEDCLNRLLMIECGSRCVLGESCSNKRFQKREYAKTEPFKTEKKGMGLKLIDAVPEGHFIMEFVGEVLNGPQFRQRIQQYSRDNIMHHYFMALKNDEVLDATQKGNSSRYINHSCDPNLETQKWTIRGELRVGFFSKRSISAGEELTFDYKFQLYGREAQKCFCGTSKCKGFIGDSKPFLLAFDISSKLNRRKKIIQDDFVVEEEVEKLCELGCLRNKEDTRIFARLMVRVEDVETRHRLLDVILNTTQQPCLRLLLDYHGLKLFWSWMADADDINLKYKLLKSLSILPIPNITMLKDSNVLKVVEKWSKFPQKEKDSDEKSENKDGETTKDQINEIHLLSNANEEENKMNPQSTPSTDSVKSDEDSIDNLINEEKQTLAESMSLASKLLESWKSLKEEFRIPRLAVQKRKDDEAKADTSSNTLSKTNSEKADDPMTAKGSEKNKYRTSSLKSEEKKIKSICETSRFKTSSTLSKEQRRNMFAAAAKKYIRQDAKRDKFYYPDVEPPNKIQKISVINSFQMETFQPNQGPPWEQQNDQCTSWEQQSNQDVSWEQQSNQGTLWDQQPAQGTSWDQQSTQGTTWEQQSTQSTSWEQQPENYAYSTWSTTASVGEVQTPPNITSTSYSAPPPLNSAIPPPHLPSSFSYPPPKLVFPPTVPPPNPVQLPPVPIPAPPNPVPVQLPPVPLPGQTGMNYPIEQTSIYPSTSNYSSSADNINSFIPQVSVSSSVPSPYFTTLPPAQTQVLPQASVIQPSSTSIPAAISYSVYNAPAQSIETKPKASKNNAKKVPKELKLPKNWRIAQDADDSIYYYHVFTRKTQWQFPTESDDSDDDDDDSLINEKDSGHQSQRISTSLPEVSKVTLPKNWKSAVGPDGSVYYYHIYHREPQWDPPDPNLEDDDDYDSDDSSHNVAPPKMEKKKGISAAADTSITNELVQKVRKNFMFKINPVVKECLNTYFTEDSAIGRITCSADFKYLCRKLTHTLVSKEVKHCRNGEFIVCDDDVRKKAKDFIKKYMSNQGPVFQRKKSSSDE